MCKLWLSWLVSNSHFNYSDMADGEGNAPSLMAGASMELCELEEEFEFLSRQVSRREISVPEYSRRRAEKLRHRDEIIARTPTFWLRVLVSYPAVAAQISAADCPLLRALTNVQVQHNNESDGGYRVLFTFEKNQFFRNETLQKSYSYCETNGLIIENDIIQWLDEDNDGDDGDQGGRASRCFFQWFQEKKDYHLLGEIFRDEIIPKAVLLFHGSWHPNDELFGDTDSDTESTLSANSNLK